MNKNEVIDTFFIIKDAKREWAQRITEFTSGVDAIMSRLLHEAAVNYMSPEEVADASGFTVKRVRDLMRNAGLNPRDGKTLLSKKAAEALATNAVLLGIEPGDMDLTSPLAYLPMGSEMKKDLRAKQVSQVDPDEFLETELPEYKDRRCRCKMPVSSGSLNNGAEVCMYCTYVIA